MMGTTESVTHTEKRASTASLTNASLASGRVVCKGHQLTLSIRASCAIMYRAVDGVVGNGVDIVVAHDEQVVFQRDEIPILQSHVNKTINENGVWYG